MTFPLDPAAPVPPDGEPNAAEVLSLIYVMLTGAEPMWAEMPADERCARAANEAQQAFLAIEAAAAGRAAATPDPPTDERRPWPIAPDTVMPPRRQPVRWGSRADDPPTEIHDDPGKTKAYLAGLAAGRTEAAAASPDERLREAAAWLVEAAVHASTIASVSARGEKVSADYHRALDFHQTTFVPSPAHDPHRASPDNPEGGEPR